MVKEIHTAASIYFHHNFHFFFKKFLSDLFFKFHCTCGMEGDIDKLTVGETPEAVMYNIKSNQTVD